MSGNVRHGHGYRVELFAGSTFQAFGEVDGREFFFRAKICAWVFEVANAHGRSPADAGFEPEEAVGTEYAAEWFCHGKFCQQVVLMSEDDIFPLIKDCIDQYREQSGNDQQ